jgi:hypothetical protein
MPISNSDLAQIEMSASLTLSLVAELRRAREAASLARAEAHRDAVDAANARRELAAEHAKLEAARARILELETTREVDTITDAGELETLRGRLDALQATPREIYVVAFNGTNGSPSVEFAATTREACFAHLKGKIVTGAMGNFTHRVSLSAEPATVKP